MTMCFLIHSAALRTYVANLAPYVHSMYVYMSINCRSVKLHTAYIHYTDIGVRIVPYFTVEAPVSNKRPPPILSKKYCVGLITLELVPTVNYWFTG